jgi:hypothetical protein
MIVHPEMPAMLLRHDHKPHMFLAMTGVPVPAIPAMHQ